jgi:quercetin dioxygenase-like cupin family protein
MEHYTWDEIDKEILSPTIARRSEKAMVAQVFPTKGAVVAEHKHESEQITYILEGALRFEIDGQEILVGKGQVLRIPSWKLHKATALEDTLDLDIFSPIRERLAEEGRCISSPRIRHRGSRVKGSTLPRFQGAVPL